MITISFEINLQAQAVYYNEHNQIKSWLPVMFFIDMRTHLGVSRTSGPDYTLFSYTSHQKSMKQTKKKKLFLRTLSLSLRG